MSDSRAKLDKATRDVRAELQKQRKQRGADADTVVFNYGDLVFGFNLQDINAIEAEGLMRLQQRKIVDAVNDIKGNSVFIFEGDEAPNMLGIVRRNGSIRLLHAPHRKIREQMISR